MKSYIKIAAIWLAVSGLVACDSEFEQLNKNPVNATPDQFRAEYLFTTAQLRTFAGDETSTLYYGSTISQHFASLSDRGIFDFFGDKYIYHESANDNLWNSTFDGINGASKLIADIFYMTEGKEEYHNLIQMNRIWRTIVFSRLTDMYGDVPYSEAGKGYYEQIFKPKYDSQKDIYYHMLAELEDAIAKLDPQKNSFPAADIAYKGDIQKWKKMGYSMMLRLGMRLTKVEPATAESWVKKAFAGGTLASNADNLMIRGVDPTGANLNLVNGQSQMFRVNYVPGKISASLFNFLKNASDPRLKYIPALYPDWRNNSSKNTDPALQKGLPNGLDRISMEGHPSFDPTKNEHQYSGINRDLFAKLDAPRMFLTFAESQLLLAEAATRGWINADAKSLYENAVAGAMKIFTEFDAAATISDAEISSYLASNPFVGTNDAEKAIEQINTQYWVATFLNGHETYANLRRSGYPKLTPVSFADSDSFGKIPSRLRYPQSEMVYNKANYEAAVARQGADNFSTSLWWDKQ